MAIVQISKILHRSGNIDSLPQLDAAEFGLAVDYSSIPGTALNRLFIGPVVPVVSNSAPLANNVEILTQYSILSKIANGNSNVSIPIANGNITMSVAGNANIVVITGTGANINGNLGLSGNMVAAGNAPAISNTSASTIQLLGNSGIALDTGNVWIGGLFVTENTTVSTSPLSGALQVKGGAGIVGNAYVGGGANVTGIINTISTTTATSTTSGALQVAGGAGIVGNVYIGSNLYAQGNSILGSNANVLISGGSNGQTLVTNGTSNLRWGLPIGIENLANTMGANAETGNLYGPWTFPVNMYSATPSTTLNGTWLLAPGTTFNATYADLAEYYLADAHYESGTVLEFGGAHEVTLAEDETTRVAGVVSTNPAYGMNANLQGEHIVALALQGRVPCKVRGTINKGDMMISAGGGYARPTHSPKMGTIIGKALQDFSGEGVIEIAVGRL